MAKRSHEVYDLEGTRLTARDWVRTDSSTGSTLVIPLEEKRHQIAAISTHDDIVRVYVDPTASKLPLDITEIRVGARAYAIKWCTHEEMHKEGISGGAIEEEDNAPYALCLHGEQRILLREDLALSPLSTLEALWHECGHILEYICGETAEGGWSEALVDSIGVQLVNILVQSGFIDASSIRIAGRALGDGA